MVQHAQRHWNTSAPVLREHFQRRRVIFTDKTIIGLYSDDCRQWFWREPGNPQKLKFSREVALYQEAEGSKGSYTQSLNSINSDTAGYNESSVCMYIESIIRCISCSLCNELGEKFSYMDDNARRHCSRMVQGVLEGVKTYYLTTFIS